jgi:hypothetical protein
MQTVSLVLGSLLMLLGVALIVAAVFRSLDHRWGLGAHELWLLPAVGLGLALLGRWLVR